jgi:hypothetical protein
MTDNTAGRIKGVGSLFTLPWCAYEYAQLVNRDKPASTSSGSATKASKSPTTRPTPTF